jgi:phage host-nuclease inhibitor protein Gam
MATTTKRKKVAAPPAALITGWDEADKALAELGKLTEGIKNREAVYNQQEIERREKFMDSVQEQRDRVLALEAGLKNYCEANREEFSKKKTKELKHGKLSFRLGTPKLVTLKNFTWAAVQELIKKAGMADVLIRTKEELNKEAVLENYASYVQSGGEQGCSAEELKGYGCEVVQEETFAYEVKLAIDN